MTKNGGDGRTSRCLCAALLYVRLAGRFSRARSAYLLFSIRFAVFLLQKIIAQYDLSVTTFSPDGKVFQVDYASKAIEKSGCAVQRHHERLRGWWDFCVV